MKAIKSLVLILAITTAGNASAGMVYVSGTLDGQTNRTLSGTNTFTGYIEVDTTGLIGLSLTSDGDFTSSIGGAAVTYYAGSEWVWSSTRSIPVNGSQWHSWLIPNGFGWIMGFEIGNFTEDSAGDFNGTMPDCSGSCPSVLSLGWDVWVLTVYLDAGFDMLSATLETTELEGVDAVFSTYSLWQSFSPLAAATPEVPLPAAAWLFGSGLIGLAGAAFRRTGSHPKGGR